MQLSIGCIFGLMNDADSTGMKKEEDLSCEAITGLQAGSDGLAVLGGPLLALADSMDRLFCRWAAEFGAERQRHPPLLSAAQMDKIDYFESFPHLAIFPVSLARDGDNIEQFTDDSVSSSGQLNLTEIAPVHHCLAPAACLHAFFTNTGQRLNQCRYITLKSPCFRREQTISPLQRQTAFTMREIICMGSKDDVEAFLSGLAAIVTAFFAELALPVRLEHATDPFFSPRKNAKYMMQKTAPLKHEMVYNDQLALGSINFHTNAFGNAFDIQYQGEAAYSGCVAFGLERWIFAFLEHFGPEQQDWPNLDDYMR